MKILIDATILNQKLTGMERVVLESAKSLINACINDDFVVIVNNKIPKELKPFQCSNVKFVKAKLGHWKLIRKYSIPKIMNKEKADINLFCGFPSPYESNHTNSVSLIHDLNPFKFPETMQKNSASEWRNWIKKDVKENKGIITVSNTVKNEIKAKFKCDQLKCIYPGLTKTNKCDESVLKDFDLKKDEYILFVSTIEPRKNIDLLVKAYNKLYDENKIKYKLVLAGKMGWNIPSELIETINDSDNIVWTDHVNDEKLSALYQNCRLFIMPSIYEGFGLPVIEAISYGAPILLSDIDVFKEITNNEAHYFESNDVVSLKNEIITALKDNKKSYTVTKNILKDYNWENYGKELRSYIKELVND